MGLAAEEGSTRIGAARLQYTVAGPLHLAGVSVTRVDISTTGEEWKTIFTGSASVDVQGPDVKIGVAAVSVDPDEYHGIRVYFGSSGTYSPFPFYSGGRYQDGSNAQDLKGQSPWTYSTLNGNLSFPAVVKRGQAIYVVLAFTPKPVMTADRRYFLIGYVPSSARTTRFVE